MRNRIIMQKLKAVIDFIALAAGIAALTCILFFPSGRVWSENLCIAAGITGAGYLAYAVFLFFFRKIEFDRKLICGNFLRKVICIVLLLPFTLTLVIGIFVSDPKEIAYEESLYGLDDDGVETLRERQTSPGLFWSVYFHFVDPGNQHMSSTRTGRGIAGLAAILGIFLLNGTKKDKGAQTRAEAIVFAKPLVTKCISSISPALLFIGSTSKPASWHP